MIRVSASPVAVLGVGVADELQVRYKRVMNKYDPLENYLLSQDSDYIKVSFEQIADLVDGLPETAYSRPE